MNVESIRSLSERKLVRWGQGLVVFITREAKSCGWNDKTKVKVAVIREKGEDQIVIKAAD